MEIAEFLLARIADDEAAARDAIDPDRPGAHWRWEIPGDAGDPDAPRWLRTTEEFPTTSGVGSLPAFPLGYEFQAEPSRGMAHIARHDPARILAECQAKRRIVEDYVLTLRLRNEAADRIRQAGDSPAGTDLRSWSRAAGEIAVMAGIVALLALPYADHPDYDPEWKV